MSEGSVGPTVALGGRKAVGRGSAMEGSSAVSEQMGSGPMSGGGSGTMRVGRVAEGSLGWADPKSIVSLDWSDPDAVGSLGWSVGSLGVPGGASGGMI